MIGLLLSAVLVAAALGDRAPCVRPTRAGTQVQGEVRICPGRYRIPDPEERGVIVAASSGTRIDLTGVTLESGDSVPARFVGVGIAGRGVDAVSILGGRIRGYRHGVRLEGGRGHRISGIDVSGTRADRPRSTPERFDEADRLDPTRPDSGLRGAGSGIYLHGTEAPLVTGVTARGGQHGIGLVGVRGGYLADNDVSRNSGWGIHLWRSSHNVLARNRAEQVGRCAPPSPGQGCASAAILLREGSDSNTLVDNALGGSTTGVLLTGRRPLTAPSIGNLVLRNDASFTSVAGFALAFTWGNALLENRADSVAIGVRLERVTGATVRGITVVGAREVGILSEQGADNAIVANTLLGGPVGIRITAEDSAASRAPRIDDNTLIGLDQGIVLEHTIQGRVRGNLFDRVGEGLVIDGAGQGTDVTGNAFLRARRWYIRAPELAAGGNYWATADAAAAASRVRGRISVLPWRPASAAGY